MRDREENIRAPAQGASPEVEYYKLSTVELREIREFLKTKHALNDFDELLRCGCDAYFLAGRLAVMGTFSPAAKGELEVDIWSATFGFDPDQLESALQEFHDCANKLERLARSFIGGELITNRAQGGRWAALLLHTPTDLRDFVEQIHLRKRDLIPRKRPWLTELRKEVTEHVIQKTRKAHDRELARVFSAVLRSSITARAQKDWRHKHHLLPPPSSGTSNTPKK